MILSKCTINSHRLDLENQKTSKCTVLEKTKSLETKTNLYKNNEKLWRCASGTGLLVFIVYVKTDQSVLHSANGQ